MSLRAVPVACLVCLLLSGVSMAAPPKESAAEGVSPQLLTVTPPPPAPAELSLQDAVNLALEHNSGFRQSVYALLATRSSLTVARQRWGMNLLGALERAEENTNRAGAELTYGLLTGANLSLRSELNWVAEATRSDSVVALLQQPLLAGRGAASGNYEQVRSARSGYQSALLSYYLARQDLMIATIGAYLNAVAQGQVVGIQEDSVRLAEQAVRDADLREKEGLSIKIEVMRAQLRLAQAQSSAVQARQAQQDVLDQLLLLLGVQVAAAPKLVTAVAYEPVAQDVEAAVSYAVKHRPELRIADLGVEDRQAAMRIARSARLPSLDLFGGVENDGQDLGQQDWSVGLQVTVPIGSRALQENYNQAEWALLVAQQDREDLRQGITVEVRRQARAAEAARANVDIAAKAVEVSNESLTLAQRLVDEGLDTNRNVLDAQTDLTNARTDLVSSKIRYYLALVSLRRAMGMDVGELLAGQQAALVSEPSAAQPASSTGEAAAGQPAPAIGGVGATESSR